MSTTDFRPENPQSSYSHFQALKAYLPPSVMSRLEQHNLSNDKSDAITLANYLRTFFDKGAFDMRRYGSVTELDLYLKRFKNFIGSDRELGGTECSKLNRTPEILEDSNRKGYIAKQDTVITLQEHFCAAYPLDGEKKLLSLVLFALLKCHESSLNSTLEFVAEDELMAAFQVDIDVTEKWFHYPEVYKLEERNGILATMKKLLPNFDCATHAAIYNILKMFHKSLFDQKTEFKNIFHKMNKLVSHFNQLVARNLPIFARNSETPNISKPHILRQFNDGDRSFVMVDEVARVVPVQRGNERNLRTMALDCAKKMTNNKPIFIWCPIQRDIHASNLVRTPDDGYCKLAVDLMFETLDEWIFGSKIFQKLQESEWEMMERFFTQQKHHFDPDEKSIYFVRMADFKADESTRNTFFNSIVNRPAKQIRNAKADGFTVQNLKNEMVKQLELHRLFPEIEGYAETAYDYVMLHKIGTVLRTCDLFDAIKHCVLMALFRKLPKLNAFLHNQNGCHRVQLTTCCSTSPLPEIPRPPSRIRDEEPPNRSEEPKWKSIKIADVKLEDLVIKGDVMFSRKMICPEGLELYYNDCVLDILMNEQWPDHPTMRMERFGEDPSEDARTLAKVLLISKEDFENVRQKKLRPIELKHVLKNLLMYNSVLPNKRLYLRTISSSYTNKTEELEVFIEEVFDILVMARRQQGPVNLAISKRIGEFSENWMEERKPELIKLAELRDILKMFEVDEHLITLVPDLSDANDRLYKMPLNIGFPAIKTIFPHRLELMEKGQAMFRVFEMVVCDVDWTVEVEGCQGNKSKEHFKQAILDALQDCTKYTKVVPIDWADNWIELFKKHPHYLERKKKKMLTPHILLFDADFNDTITLSYFLKMCRNFNLEYRVPPNLSEEDLDDTAFPVWKMRLLCLLKWNAMFFSDVAGERNGFGFVVENAIRQRVPLVQWEHESDFEDVFFALNLKKIDHAKALEFQNAGVFHPVFYHDWLQTSWKSRKYIQRCGKWAVRDSVKHVIDAPMSPGKVMKLKEASTDIYMDMWERKDEVERVEKKTIQLWHNIAAFEYSVRNGGEVSEPTQRSQFPASSATTSAQISTKSEPKNSQNGKENATKKPSTSASETSSNSAKPKPKQRSQSPPSSSTPSTQGSPKPEPKKPAPKDCKTCEPLSQKHKKLLEEIKELKSKLEEMKGRVAQADKNAKALKKKEQAMKPMKDLEKEKRDLQKRIAELEEERLAREEKDKENERQLQEANKMIEELNKRNSELQQFNTEKDVKIAKLKEKFSKEELKTFNFELSSEMRQELGELQSKLDFIRANDPVGHAASQVHELKINTNDAHVQGGADYVLVVFRSEFKVYEAAVERNIEIIQADTSVLRSELVEVPALPELPPVFYTELRRAYAQKNAERAKECLICLSDDGGKFYNCEQCPIKVHYNCLVQWWLTAKEKICPHCKCVVDFRNWN